MFCGVLFAAGVLSVVYYLAIGLYTGSFGGSSVIWLLAGIVLMGSVLLLKHGFSPSRGFKRAGCIILLIGFLIFFFLEGMVISRMNAKPEKGADYIVVLGAQVRGTRITKSLRYRLDAAFAYLMDDEHTIAVMSGGQGNGEELPEAEAMKKYLVEKGIPASRIFEESKSVNTNENLKFSKKIIDEKEKREPYTIAVVTNNFHVYRAMSIGKKQGLYGMEGLAARSDGLLLVNYMVREAMAIFKDILAGNM